MARPAGPGSVPGRLREQDIGRNMRETSLPSPQEISKLFGAKNSVSGPLHLAATWAGILLTILGAAYFRSWALLPIAALLLVGLQHRLFTRSAIIRWNSASYGGIWSRRDDHHRNAEYRLRRVRFPERRPLGRLPCAASLLSVQPKKHRDDGFTRRPFRNRGTVVSITGVLELDLPFDPYEGCRLADCRCAVPSGHDILRGHPFARAAGWVFGSRKYYSQNNRAAFGILDRVCQALKRSGVALAFVDAASADDEAAGVRIGQMEIQRGRAVVMGRIAIRNLEHRMRQGGLRIGQRRRRRVAGDPGESIMGCRVGASGICLST